MGQFELYIIKSGISIGILYIFFWLFLRNETHYTWNRIYLLISLLFSLIIPMISNPLNLSVPDRFTYLIDPVIVTWQNNPALHTSSEHSISILSIIYISGAVFFCLRFLSGLVRIHFLYTRFPRYTMDGFKTVILDTDHSPFTFFNILFISRNDFNEGKVNEMIVHEIAHREGYHTIDIILLEIMTIIQWFNPFIWLFRISLKSEHEFIADNKVLKEGYDKVSYQRLLLTKSLGIASMNMTNNFNYSLLKKRFKMMTTHKSGVFSTTKYLLAMPVLLATVMLSVFNIQTFGQSEEQLPEPDIVAQYKDGGINGLMQLFIASATFPESAIEKNISAKIFVQFMVDEQGKINDVQIIRTDIVNPATKKTIIENYQAETSPQIDTKAVSDIKTEAIRVVSQLGDFTPAQKGGKAIKSQMTIPFLFSFE